MLFYNTKISEPPPENHTRITEINTRITVLRKAVRSLQKISRNRNTALYWKQSYETKRLFVFLFAIVV